MKRAEHLRSAQYTLAQNNLSLENARSKLFEKGRKSIEPYTLEFRYQSFGFRDVNLGENIQT